MLDIFRTLPGLLDGIDGAGVVREAIVFAAWRRIAGEGLADHAEPVGLHDTTLAVAVSNRMWQRHLQDLAGQMLFKLNAALGTPMVSFVEFVVDEAAVISARCDVDPDDDTELRLEAAKALTPEIESTATSIADDELRRQFLLAAGNCIVRRSRSKSRELGGR